MATTQEPVLALQVSTVMVPAITDAWYYPIEGSVFSVPQTQPQIVVHVNGMRAVCHATDGCNYMPMSDHTPVLTAVQVNGNAVVITGSGFGSQAGDGEHIPPVSFGTVLCVTAASDWADTEIRCMLETQLLPGTSMVKVCEQIGLLSCDSVACSGQLPFRMCMAPLISGNCVCRVNVGVPVMCFLQ